MNAIMKLNTCLLTNFIRDNNVVSCCDFIPEQLNEGKVIYEVVRVIGGVPLFFNEHIKRFDNSVQNSGFELSLSNSTLSLRIKTLIEINKLIDGNIKFQFCFKSDNSEVFSAWVCPFFYPSSELYTAGISMVTLDAQRNNPNVKAYNNKLAGTVKAVLKNRDVYEVLLINKDGYITEGSRSNVFFVKDDSVYTPKVSSVLPGVTRQKVIEASHNIGVNCNETNLQIDSISEFQGAFITGTSPKVLPAMRINNTNYNPLHPTIKKIIDEYDRIVEKNIQAFLWS